MAEGVRTRRREAPEVRGSSSWTRPPRCSWTAAWPRPPSPTWPRPPAWPRAPSTSTSTPSRRCSPPCGPLHQPVAGPVRPPGRTPGPRRYRQRLRSFLGEMYDFHAANQRLHHLLFHAAEVSEDEPLERARADLVRFVTRGADAGEFAVGDPEATASFLLDGVHGLLLRPCTPAAAAAPSWAPPGHRAPTCSASRPSQAAGQHQLPAPGSSRTCRATRKARLAAGMPA